MDSFILWTLVILVLVLNVKLSEAQGFYTHLDRYKYEEFSDLGTLENYYDMYGYQIDGQPAIYAMGNDNLYYSDWNKSVVYKVDLTVDPVQKTVFAGILNAPGGELSKSLSSLPISTPFKDSFLDRCET